jgi:hypothetical protein
MPELVPKTGTVESRDAHCFGAQIDELIFDLVC